MKTLRRAVFSIALWMACWACVPGYCGEENQTADPIPDKFENAGPGGAKIGAWLITLYSSTVSSVDGDRCPSVPSCSSYCKQAFQKHGFFVGWVMTVDRLIHEADESSLSPVCYHAGGLKVMDPVENNDFWWFKKDDVSQR